MALSMADKTQHRKLVYPAAGRYHETEEPKLFFAALQIVGVPGVMDEEAVKELNQVMAGGANNGSRAAQ